MVVLTGLTLMPRLNLMVGLLTRLWLGCVVGLPWRSRRPWWCALVVLVRERGGSVWWCACGGPLLWGPFWGALCCGALLVLVGRPSAAGLSRSGTSGVRCAGALVHPLGCASAVVRCRAQAAHPLVGNLMVRIRLCPTGALVPSCAGAAAWCPYYWGAPHGATTWATPVTAGVGEPKARPEQTLRT